MGFLYFLVLSFGAFIVTSASQCVPETAQCGQFWTHIEPHRNLWQTERDLNAWCSTQERFYKCLEEILLKDKKGNLADLPVNLLISKLFAKDLCTDSSHTRRRLLDNAACMNNQNTDYCGLPEYLDIVNPDDAIPATRCSFSEKTFSCIAATLVLNCGFDAGRVYRSMLKITRYSDEVCSIEVTEGIPPCDELESLRRERADRMSRIFYGLARRIGNIPEHDNEIEGSSNEVNVQRGSEKAAAVIEAVKNFLALMNIGKQENGMQGSSKDAKERAEQEDEIQGYSKAQDRESDSIYANRAVVKVLKEYIDGIGSVPELENEIQDSSNEMQSFSEEIKEPLESEQTDINHVAYEAAMQENLARSGSMSEQNEIQGSEERASGRIYSNEAVTKVIKEYLDRIGSIPELENEVQDYSRAQVQNESETLRANNEVVTEALQNALNAIDSTMAEEYKLDYMMADDAEQSTVSSENVLYKNPIITDAFKGILFYNYSDVEYALYWRQPHFTGIENVSCEQVAPFKGYVLGCVALYRYSDPDCLSKATVHEKVTPELIRDIDPDVPHDSIAEFGPRPHWMKDFDDAYDEKRLRDLTKATEEHLYTTESPVLSTTATALHIASNVACKKPKNWWDMDWMGKYTNSMIPNDLHLELMELFVPEPETFKPEITMWQFGDAYYSFIYEPIFAHNIEKSVCRRLDECHPRGRGLWKCKVIVRKTKTCAECNGSIETTEESVEETTDPTVTSEGSGILESTMPSSSAETEDVQEHDEDGSEYNQSDDDYLNNEYLSEEDELSEKELKEAITDEINYKLKTETDKQLKNDFRLLLLDSVLHPSRYEASSDHVDESDVQIEDEDSEWDIVSENDDEPEYYEDVLVIEPLSEDKSKVKYSVFKVPGRDSMN